MWSKIVDLCILYWKVHAIHVRILGVLGAAKISIAHIVPNKPSQMGHCTTIGTVVAGGGRGRRPGERTAVVRCP